MYYPHCSNPDLTLSTLILSRYDIRNRLDDKSLFGLKPNLPHRITKEEEEFEDELDKERYLALEWDEIRVEEQEGVCVCVCER